MNDKLLREIGLHHQDTLDSIRRFNKTVVESDNHKRVNRYKNRKVIQVKIPPITDKPETWAKLKYVYRRLEVKTILQEYEKLKIIWSLRDFLTLNGLTSTNKMDWLIDRDYVGVLSANNEYIIFRDITDSNKLRYFKYNIFKVLDNSNSFYTVTNKINLLSRDPIHIIAAEGYFDIWSILYNIYDGDDTNRIFVAVCNGSYYNSIMYYINKGLVGDNIHLDIYRDNDNDKFMNYKKLQKDMKPYIGDFRVYYNMHPGEKDFGVPLNRIEVGY